jgi:hypothetical protein
MSLRGRGLACPVITGRFSELCKLACCLTDLRAEELAWPA